MRFELCEICANRECPIILRSVMLTVCSDRDDDCPGFVPGNLKKEEECD